MTPYQRCQHRNSVLFSLLLLLFFFFFPQIWQWKAEGKEGSPMNDDLLAISPRRASRVTFQIPFSFIRSALLLHLAYTLHPHFLSWKLYTWSNYKGRLSWVTGICREYLQRIKSCDLKKDELLLGGILLDWLWGGKLEAEGRQGTQSEKKALMEAQN